MQKTVNHGECSKSSLLKTHEGKTDRTTHIRVWKNDRQRLMAIKAGIGFKNVAWVVHKLLEEQAKNLASVDAVMAGNVPVVLTGKPLSGKTFFIKQKLLPSLRGNPVLVIGSWDEYGQLRNIGYDIYGLNFKACMHACEASGFKGHRLPSKSPALFLIWPRVHVPMMAEPVGFEPTTDGSSVHWTPRLS